ncbi:MAG: hypothetical protein HQ572_04290 [Candidatus Omnitrophica bacterium]|nr:hypothetical protein [Candidatus Omnitrophota bacterium]
MIIRRSSLATGYWLLATHIVALTTFTFVVSSAMSMELPPGAKEYYKDRVSSAPGRSEGVGPTEKPKTQEGVDIGRRETKKYDFSDESSSALAIRSWESLNKKDEDAIMIYTARCIELYEEKAKEEESKLSDFAASGSEGEYQNLNDIAVCYFIKGEFYKHKRDWSKAKENYQKVVDDFYHAQYWDPRGWWWKPSEISQGEIEKINSGYYEK